VDYSTVTRIEMPVMVAIIEHLAAAEMRLCLSGHGSLGKHQPKHSRP
jgi:hypothetical protein